MAGIEKQLTFSEGVDVSAPSQNFIESSALVRYANEAAFVTAKGAPAANGDMFYDTTANVGKYYQNGTWQAIGDAEDVSTHAALTITHGTSSAIVGKDDTVELKNKTIDGDLNTVQDLGLGTLKTVLAQANKTLSRDASGVVIDTKNAPTGDYVGTSDTQTLTNKTVDDAITQKQIATPSTPSANYNKIYPKSDGKFYNLDSSGTERLLAGSGAGSLSIYASYNADDDVSTWSSGNNASFLGGGSLAGTFDKNNTTNPLHGTKDYKYTQAGGSLNDYFATEVISVPIRSRGKETGVKLPYIYDGADHDIDVFIYDVTQAAILETSRLQLDAASTSKTAFLSAFIPSTTTQIRIGFQVKVLNSGKILEFDDIEVSDDPFVYKNLVNLTDWESWTPTGSFTTNTTYTGKKRRVGDNLECEVKVAFSGAPNSTTLTINLPSGLTIDTSKLVDSSANIPAIGITTLYDASVKVYNGLVRYLGTTSVQPYVGTCDGTFLYGDTITQASPFAIASGDYIVVRFSVPIANWTAYTENLVAPATVQTEHYYLTQAVTDLLDATGEIRFDFSKTYTLQKNADSYLYTSWQSTSNSIYLLDDSGGSRTKFVASRNGTVFVACDAGANAASDRMTVNKNGSVVHSGTVGYTGATSIGAGSIPVKVKVGDFISVSATAMNTSYSARISFFFVPDSVTFSAAIPQRVEASYYHTNGDSMPASDTIIDFHGKIKDTHGLVTTGASWKLTNKFSKTKPFDVSCYIQAQSVAWVAGERFYARVYKNGSLEKQIAFTAVQTNNTMIATLMCAKATIDLSPNEYLDVRLGFVRAAGNINLDTVAARNWVTITTEGI